ncbi:MAG: ferric reductase-like transmembrane domain-containing protein [Patescibacteria group bacterium]
MIKKSKKIKSLYLAGLVLLLFGLSYVGYKVVVEAQTPNQADYVKDSDYDGLSDYAEINIYHTDPFKADTDGDGYLDSAEILIKSDPLNSRDPSDLLAAQTKTIAAPITTPSSIPWYITRAAAIVSYLLMFLIVFLGTGMTTGYIYSYINPVKAWMIHKYLSLALGVTLLTHIFSLLFDKFINLSLKEILVPFASNFNTLYLSLGIFGFYILLVIIFTSLWFRLKYKRAWRSIHYFVYALFVFSLVHGFFMGTDSSTIIMRIIYIVTGTIFLGLLIYRFIIRAIRK